MEIPHDLRSLEAGRPSGTGRPSSLPPSSERANQRAAERGTERSHERRSDGAGTRSADERTTEAAARRAGVARRARSSGRDAESETRSTAVARDESFEGALARESSSADGPVAPAKTARDDADEAPLDRAAADSAGELANSASVKRTATRGAGANDPAAAVAAETAEAPADAAAAPGAAPIVTLPHAAEVGLSAGTGGEIQLTGVAGDDAGDLLSPDEVSADESSAGGPLAGATDTQDTATLTSATNTSRTDALPLDAALPLAPAAHTDALAPAHAAAHVREPAGVRHVSAEVAPLAPPPPTLADAQRAAEVLRQVRLQLVPELKSAVIQLAPAELGRVSIELEIDRDQVTARVRAEQPEALGALQRHLPELRAALARQGLETQHIEFALGFQDGQRGRETQQSSRRSARAANEIEATDNVVHASAPLARALAAGGVDTYA